MTYGEKQFKKKFRKAKAASMKRKKINKEEEDV
jgi:hypothetical protein